VVKQSQATNKVRRAMKVGGLGVRIAGSYLGYQMQNLFLDSPDRAQNKKTFRQKNAQRFRKELQQLRGPVMKLGQTLSMQGHLIPEEIVEELAELQTHAPPMHPTLMRTQFKRSMGKYPEELFARFEMEPFAAASLGQVHLAVTPGGEEVAVKIQYPAIREAIRNDFALLRTVTLPTRWAKYVSDEMISEAENGFMLETDYENEAKNIELFGRHAPALPFLSVPDVFREYSSKKVLTMSFMRGEFLDQRLERKPSQAWRNRLGGRLFELFLYQFYNMDAIHADPHPGNYLYDDDGTIALIDFGCVKYLPDDILRNSHAMADHLWEQDEASFAEALQAAFQTRIDFSDPKSQPVLKAFTEYLQVLMPPKSQKGAVDFGQTTVLESTTALWDRVLKTCPPNPEVFFLCRQELGLFNVLYRLGAKVPTAEITERVRGADAVA
jgi:predicted unusual protein kinase regulating ubiquinone biosynthesis (AarF/ABC1/UbiB family)